MIIIKFLNDIEQRSTIQDLIEYSRGTVLTSNQEGFADIRNGKVTYSIRPDEGTYMYDTLAIRYQVNSESLQSVSQILQTEDRVTGYFVDAECELSIFTATSYAAEQIPEAYRIVSAYFDMILKDYGTRTDAPVFEEQVLPNDPTAYYNATSQNFDIYLVPKIPEDSYINKFQAADAYTANILSYAPGVQVAYVKTLANYCNRQGIPLKEAKSLTLQVYSFDVDLIIDLFDQAYNQTQEHGVGLPKDKEYESAYEKAKKFLDGHIKVRFNVVTQRTEVKSCKNGDCVFEPLDDRLEASIFLKMVKKVKAASMAMLRTILTSDYAESYDPFAEYFTSLRPWDGKTDYIQQLAATVTISDQSYFRKYLEMYLASMVKCALKPNNPNQLMLLFTGAQGIGKTTWIRNLVPWQLRRYYFEGSIQPNDKDAQLMLSNRLLINLDEFESMNKVEISALKSFMLREVVVVRPAYGRYLQISPRRASFAGSANGTQLFSDTTGNRRYITIKASAFDNLMKVNIDDVMAQAYALQMNEQYRSWPNHDDIVEINAANEEFRNVSPEEELVNRFFRKPLRHEIGAHMTTTEVHAIIKEHYPGNIYPNQLGRVLRSLGHEPCKRNGTSGYLLIQRSMLEISDFKREDPKGVQINLDLSKTNNGLGQ